MNNNDKIELCKNIKSNITFLAPSEIEEIFKILHKNNSTYTKNNNGIFVNLNWIDDATLNNINDYINFCIKSHNEINKYEDLCSILNDNINKDKQTNLLSSIIEVENTNKTIIPSIKQRTSSSMKFYLLKKKFMKQNVTYKNNINIDNNNLTQEKYLIE